MRKLMALLLAMALLMTSAPMALAEAVLPEKAAEQVFSRVYDSEYNSLNYLYESSGESICNFVDTLVEYDNYGILNDPSLSASLPGLDWDALTAEQVFASIQGALYGRLVGQTKGLIDRSTPMKMILSPENEVNLLKTNQYNVNVVDQLKKNFPSLTIETPPEYSTPAGEIVQLVVESYEGVRTIEPTFTEKMRVHPMVLGLSSWQQKRSQGTVGAIIYRPMMVASLILT